MSIQIRAEKIIIHDILVNPGDMHKIMEKIDTTMITDPVNKAVFEAITSLYLSQEAINTTSLFHEVCKLKSIAAKKAASEISSLIAVSPGKEELKDAMNLVVSETIRNEHVTLSQTISNMASQPDYEPANILNLLQDHITNNKYKSILNKKVMTI